MSELPDHVPDDPDEAEAYWFERYYARALEHPGRFRDGDDPESRALRLRCAETVVACARRDHDDDRADALIAAVLEEVRDRGLYEEAGFGSFEAFLTATAPRRWQLTADEVLALLRAQAQLREVAPALERRIRDTTARRLLGWLDSPDDSPGVPGDGPGED